MALIKVRATGLGFNGGPNAKSKSIWAYTGDRSRLIADEDRGLKNIGDVFMVDEKQFTPSWMERLDAPKAVEPVAVAAQPIEAPRKAGRPKKVV